MRFDPREREIVRIMSPSRIRASRLLPALILTTTLGAGAAHAQPAGDDTQRRAVAQALFDEAQKLIAANNYSLACIKLEEVVRLQPGKIGAVLALARCYEGEGKIASAWSRYKNVADASKVAGDARGAEAEKKIVELEKRLPRLTIVIRETVGALPGLSVKRDDVDVTAAQWGVAIPMDPGEHRIEVTAPGRKPWTQDATVSDGKATTIEVPELDSDSPAPPITAAPTAAPKPTVTVAPTASLGPRETPSNGLILGLPGKTWGLVVGGVGVAGLIVGGVAGGLALGQHDALAKACPNGTCPASKKGDLDAYEATGTASTVGFVAGGVLAAAGAALWIFYPPAKPPSAAGVTPYATFGGAGIAGRF